MSNVSTEDLGRVILEDVSAATVSRCEMRTGASLTASAIRHFEIMKAETLEAWNEGFSICLHSYRQDASNSRRKVVALELDSAYVSNITSKLEKFLDWTHFNRMRRLADLGHVGDESGRGCVGTTLRGLASLGCPSWRELQECQSETTRHYGVQMTKQFVRCKFFDAEFSSVKKSIFSWFNNTSLILIRQQMRNYVKSPRQLNLPCYNCEI